MDYCFIPVIYDEFAIDDFSIEEVADKLMEKIIDRNIYYVYFVNRCSNEELKNIFSNITVDQVDVSAGTMYYFDKEKRKLANEE